MKLTFVSNYINHHQAAFCSALYEELREDFSFIQTEPMSEERLRSGWAVDERMFSYVHFFREEREALSRRFLESDIVLLGWSALPGGLIRERLLSGKPAFRISERIYKEGRYKAISPRGLREKYRSHIRYRKKPVYMLCADAYAAADFQLIHSYPGKMLRFGYFPETRRKAPVQWRGAASPMRLLWAGRMLKLKHPEYALLCAKALKEKGYDFRLHMVGDGPMREAVEEMAREEELFDCVILHATKTPYEVRALMEQSQIYLFTSSYLEGWGAVVNEAMNSGCAVVASGEAGSVPYLIREGVNGLTYPRGSYRAFESQVLDLMEKPMLAEALGRAAYKTITETWNAQETARRLLALCTELLETGRLTPYPDEGPLSRAPLLKGPSLFRTLHGDGKQDEG